MRYSPEDMEYRISEVMRSNKLDPTIIEYAIVIFFIFLMIAMGYLQ